jgi:hypothetical protein
MLACQELYIENTEQQDIIDGNISILWNGLIRDSVLLIQQASRLVGQSNIYIYEDEIEAGQIYYSVGELYNRIRHHDSKDARFQECGNSADKLQKIRINLRGKCASCECSKPIAHLPPLTGISRTFVNLFAVALWYSFDSTDSFQKNQVRTKKLRERVELDIQSADENKDAKEALVDDFQRIGEELAKKMRDLNAIAPPISGVGESKVTMCYYEIDENDDDVLVRTVFRAQQLRFDTAFVEEKLLEKTSKQKKRKRQKWASFERALQIIPTHCNSCHDIEDFDWDDTEYEADVSGDNVGGESEED